MKVNNEVMNAKQSKFKVGDKVRILRKDTTFGWDEDMGEFIGQEVTIDYAAEGYTEGAGGLKFGYGIAGWMWSEEALELISESTEQPQPKEQTYTEEQIRKAWKITWIDGAPKREEIFFNHLKKSTGAEYELYLKLKEKFE